MGSNAVMLDEVENKFARSVKERCQKMPDDNYVQAKFIFKTHYKFNIKNKQIQYVAKLY